MSEEFTTPMVLLITHCLLPIKKPRKKFQGQYYSLLIADYSSATALIPNTGICNL